MTNPHNTCEICKKDYTRTTTQTYIYSCSKTRLNNVRICAFCLLKHVEKHYPGSPLEAGMKIATEGVNHG